MDMPQLTEAHEKLARLEGAWEGKERMHPSPWAPEGFEATGTVTNRIALGGFALIQDYEQRRGENVTFSGHGVFTYDPDKDHYVLYWWDSTGFPVNQFVGKFRGDTLSMSYAGEQGHHRAVFDIDSDTSYRFVMEVSPEGQMWQPAMEGEYTKKA